MTEAETETVARTLLTLNEAMAFMLSHVAVDDPMSQAYRKQLIDRLSSATPIEGPGRPVVIAGP